MIPILLSALALAGPSIPHEKYELDNGLDVILAPDPSHPIVSVNLWYHVGSGDEEPGLTGFAHLFEHLMFQGSPSSPGEYFGPLEAVGARINGTTSADRTNYFETLPAEHLPLALFLESDRMGWLLETLDQDMLDNQREVVRNERRQRIEDPPYGTAWMDLYAALFPPGHPYHHPVIGSHEDLENATLDDARAFFRKFYGPNNASLVVTGAFDAEVTKELVERYFGNIPAGEPVSRPLAAPVRLSETVRIHKFSGVPRQRLYMAWHAPPAFADGEAELQILADVLSGGRESRLDQALVHQEELASMVTAFVSGRRHGSVLVVIAEPTDEHDTNKLAAEIQRVIGELLTSRPPEPEEIQAAVAQIELRAADRLQTLRAKADLLNHYNMHLGTPNGLERDLARFEGLTGEHLQAVARDWLDQPHVALHIWPEAQVSAEEAPGFWRRLLRRKGPVTAKEESP